MYGFGQATGHARVTAFTYQARPLTSLFPAISSRLLRGAPYQKRKEATHRSDSNDLTVLRHKSSLRSMFTVGNEANGPGGGLCSWQ